MDNEPPTPEMLATPQGDSQVRHFCFTQWNMEPKPEVIYADLFSYIIYQLELTPTTGKRHYQGYVQIGDGRHPRIKTIQKLNPTVWAEPTDNEDIWNVVPARTQKSRPISGAYIKICRGSDDQNYSYCCKEESRAPDSEPVEYGKRRGAPAKFDRAKAKLQMVLGTYNPKETPEHAWFGATFAKNQEYLNAQRLDYKSRLMKGEEPKEDTEYSWFVAQNQKEWNFFKSIRDKEKEEEQKRQQADFKLRLQEGVEPEPEEREYKFYLAQHQKEWNYFQTLRLKEEAKEVDFSQTKLYYLWGTYGTGKTTSAKYGIWEDGHCIGYHPKGYDDYYQVLQYEASTGTPWMNEYQGQDRIVIDEIDKKKVIPLAFILDASDRTGRGGVFQAKMAPPVHRKWTKVFLTGNVSPEILFGHTQYTCLQRRMTCIRIDNVVDKISIQQERLSWKHMSAIRTLPKYEEAIEIGSFITPISVPPKGDKIGNCRQFPTSLNACIKPEGVSQGDAPRPNSPKTPILDDDTESTIMNRERQIAQDNLLAQSLQAEQIRAPAGSQISHILSDLGKKYFPAQSASAEGQ